MNVFEKWVCVHPGKMGLYWKIARSGEWIKEEAEIEASKNCNVVAIPLELFNHIEDIQNRVFKAESLLNSFDVALGNISYWNKNRNK
jgi:hypothetical protein